MSNSFEHIPLKSDDKGLYQFIPSGNTSYIKQYILVYDIKDEYIYHINNINDKMKKEQFRLNSKLWFIYNQLRKPNTPKESL